MFVMNLISCSVRVDCTDEGGWWHGVDAIDLGDKYRIVMRWADSIEFPDQGMIPGLYHDVVKHLFKPVEHPELGPLLRCDKILTSDKTYTETFGK